MSSSRSRGLPRPSRNAPRRAFVLVAVNVLIGVHALHFLLAGRTLSPIEPSEAMYTLELGEVNAGFLFFLFALLATLIAGRFVCGWGCHVVALQDLCATLLSRFGLRPRPLRSRALAWAPMVLALYMFVWPSFRRLVLGVSDRDFPGFSNHLVTDGFWDTFPAPVFAVLTLVTCGFVVVWLLGSKGFCTYGCPYGALFGVADRFAPGRIVVDDNCHQCGDCTATCTSNVLVHLEVKEHGKVVDPGCMKCLDCVSVCPNGALSFGFTRPPALGGANPRARRGPRPLAGGEELLVAAVALGTTLTYRGLYDGPPLLMAIGLGGLTAFVALTLWRLMRRETVRLQSLLLREGGAMTRSGLAFALIATTWLGFTVHSGFIQWNRVRGRAALESLEAPRLAVLSGTAAAEGLEPPEQARVDAAHRHFALAESWGLVPVSEVKLGLAWTELLRGDGARGEALVREAIALEPEEAQLHENLVELHLARGRREEATSALEAKIAALAESSPADHLRLGTMYLDGGRSEQAVEQFRLAVGLAPDSLEARYNLGGLLRRSGRAEEAARVLRAAAELAPGDPDVQVELGLALAETGNGLEAIAAFERAIELAPERPESRLHLPGLIQQLQRSLRR